MAAWCEFYLNLHPKSSLGVFLSECSWSSYTVRGLWGRQAPFSPRP